MRTLKHLSLGLSLIALLVFSFSTPAADGRGPGGRAGAGARGGHGGAKPAGKKRSRDRNQPVAGSLGGKATIGPPGSHSPPAAWSAGKLQPGQRQSGHWNHQLPANLQQQASQWTQKESQWRKRRAQQPTGQWQQNAQQQWQQFQNGPEPFSPAWYAEHPNAWHVTHPYADEAFVATTAAVVSWLGWAYYPPAYGNSSTTVIYESVPVEQPVEETSAEVPIQSHPQPPTTNDAEQWLPLGVYAILTAPNRPSTQHLQLAVDRLGNVRGAYYDAVTNTTHNVVGHLDQETRVATWRLESNDQLTFSALLEELTQPEGTVRVTRPDGQQQWRLVRLDEASN